MSPPRVAVFSELPTPYRWPVYRRLLANPEIRLVVFFLARGEPDRHWRFPFETDERVRFLPGFTLSATGRRTVHYHVNPGVFGTLRRGGFDAVVFPGWAMFASQTGAAWCRATGRPYLVFSESHGLIRRSLASRLARALVARPIVTGARAWLAAGQAAADHLVSLGAHREGIFAFPNSPDVRELARAAAAARPSRGAVRERLGTGLDPAVLFVGRLISVKRVDLLVGAIRGLREKGLPVHLWIAGEGPERRRLERQAISGCAGAVRFLGTVEYGKLPELYTAADALALPSDHEPWGAVVGEAMACGLPVVASDAVGAAPDLILPGRTGATFPRGSGEGLLHALGEILTVPEVAQSMGREAARHVVRFDHEACAASFLAAVRAALATGRGRGRRCPDGGQPDDQRSPSAPGAIPSHPKARGP